MSETMMGEQRLKKPEPWKFVALMHSRYKGRDFYGDRADDIAELYYLRDYKAWADQELSGLNAFARSVNEALNSGDGSYRP